MKKYSVFSSQKLVEKRKSREKKLIRLTAEYFLFKRRFEAAKDLDLSMQAMKMDKKMVKIENKIVPILKELKLR